MSLGQGLYEWSSSSTLHGNQLLGCEQNSHNSQNGNLMQMHVCTDTSMNYASC